ncbi:hypothetical protein CKC67_24515 [Salmonella enterica]|nr:hypothetical protein [Salmonella enterica]
MNNMNKLIMVLPFLLTNCGFRTPGGQDCIIDPIAPVTGILTQEFSPVACQPTQAQRNAAAKRKQDAEIKAAALESEHNAKVQNDTFEREFQAEIQRAKELERAKETKQ